jgi:cell division FtsZ-interacting protein ZapD
MVFRRVAPRRNTRHFRLRVESCINTILDLDQHLGEGKIKPEIIRQFQKLKEYLRYVNDESMDEKEIDRIEAATNQLMAEISSLYGKERIGNIHQGNLH